MTFDKAEIVLEKLGVECRRYDQVDDWSELPDLAIIAITVQGGEFDGQNHGVVFARTDDGEEVILDNLNDRPVSRHGYVLTPNDDYIEILIRE